MEKFKKTDYSKVVYLSHPYGNQQKNLLEITDILQMCVKLHPDILFISPVNMYSSLYDITDYEQGLKMCIALLDIMADEMWIFGDYQHSKGCVEEINYCHRNGIPYIYKDLELLKLKVGEKNG